jgi:hypothetical protein
VKKKVTPAEMANILRGFGNKVPEDCRRAIDETTIELAGAFVQEAIAETTPHQPVDQAQYKAGWRYGFIDDGDSHTGYVYNITKQSFWIERGRKPGGSVGGVMKAIEPWAKRHGMTRSQTFLIARKIAAQGYKPRWVLKRANKRARLVLRARIVQALARRFK